MRSLSAEEARALHRDAVVVDGHNDLPWRLRERGAIGEGLAALDRRLEEGHTDLVRLREGGVDVQFWAAYVPARFRGREATGIAREQIGLIHDLVARHPSHLGLASSATEAEEIVGSGRIASMIGVEGGHAIDGSLDVLREFHESGARYLTLTHNESVGWADAAGDAEGSGGLSDFGREVVAELNRLGMLVDLSHVSEKTMRDALDATRAPVVFSHSSARALADHPRNVPDAMLERLPDNGGVVMVNFFSGFLTPGGAASVPELFAEEERIRARHADPGDRRAAVEAWWASVPEVRGTVETIADHVEHIADVAGTAHVGLGSDFDGIPMTPAGMEDVSRFPALTEVLAGRGWQAADLEAVLGGNALRVLREAERLSEE